MTKTIFPIWWLVLAAFLTAGYVVFGIDITVKSWDVLTGADVGEFAVWRTLFWSIGVGGGVLGLVAVLVFSHVFGVMQPAIQKGMRDCRPPSPPPYVKPARHN